jgi:hypothetical protein
VLINISWTSELSASGLGTFQRVVLQLHMQHACPSIPKLLSGQTSVPSMGESAVTRIKRTASHR